MLWYVLHALVTICENKYFSVVGSKFKCWWIWIILCTHLLKLFFALCVCMNIICKLQSWYAHYYLKLASFQTTYQKQFHCVSPSVCMREPSCWFISSWKYWYMITCSHDLWSPYIPSNQVVCSHSSSEVTQSLRMVAHAQHHFPMTSEQLHVQGQSAYPGWTMCDMM